MNASERHPRLSFFAALAMLVILEVRCTPSGQLIDENNMIEEMLEGHRDLFGTVLDHLEKYQVQILYTQIDRDENNFPSFCSYRFRVDSTMYFYPGSTVKLPAAVLALEKLNDLNVRGLNRDTPLRIDSAYAGQTGVTVDSTSEAGLPSVGHYIKKIFLVSDNDAFNRLYEFLGQQELNETLWKKGFIDLRIIHRLSVLNTPDQNRYTNPLTFYADRGTVYAQPLVCNENFYNKEPGSILRGDGYILGDSLIRAPKDFSFSNFISIENLQGILKSVLFPEAASELERFNLTDDDYKFLYKCMSMLPLESQQPTYDSLEYYDSYGKYFLFGDSKRHIPPDIRVFNKVGQAYGFLIDNAYVVDFARGVEFLLTAVIYVNENQIFNDDKYEYDEVGMPFLANLGRVVYEYESQRKRLYSPNLEKFRIDYHN